MKVILALFIFYSLKGDKVIKFKKTNYLQIIINGKICIKGRDKNAYKE